MTTYRVTFHLSSGKTVITEVEYDDSFSDEEIAEDIRKTLAGNDRPGWFKYENIIGFSQAVPAVEFEEITTGGNPE